MIQYIKKEYSPKEVQDDLMHDSMMIFAHNYRATVGYKLTQDDIGSIMNSMKKCFYITNDLDIDWDQTS